MNTWCMRLAGATILAAIGGISSANALPSVMLGPGNSGITSFSAMYDDATKTFNITETWTSVDTGILKFSDLDDEVNYTVKIKLINNTAVNWSSIANELLDPRSTDSGTCLGVQLGMFCEDLFDSDQALATVHEDPPAGIPTGTSKGANSEWSVSNNDDGLSFAQGPTPGDPPDVARTSDIYSLISVEEDDGRDFLDFLGSGGEQLLAGNMGMIMFGLRDENGIGDENCNPDNETDCPNNPFLLMQGPTLLSDPEGTYTHYVLNPIDTPEPATLAIFGIGLAGLGLMRRRRTV
jgi:hypothetical protein